MTKTQKPHTAKCLRCGRTLKSAKSISDGMGRTCKAKVRAAANVIDLSAFKDAKAALAKATDLIEQGGLIPTSRQGFYAAVSSDGSTTYLVDVIEQSCTCKGFGHHQRCNHLVAGNILASSARRSAC